MPKKATQMSQSGAHPAGRHDVPIQVPAEAWGAVLVQVPERCTLQSVPNAARTRRFRSFPEAISLCTAVIASVNSLQEVPVGDHTDNRFDVPGNIGADQM